MPPTAGPLSSSNRATSSHALKNPLFWASLLVCSVAPSYVQPLDPSGSELSCIRSSKRQHLLLGHSCSTEVGPSESVITFLTHTGTLRQGFPTEYTRLTGPP